MGKPLVMTGKNERYSRVEDKEAFDETMDGIQDFAKRPNGLARQKGRTVILYRGGKRIVVVEDGKKVGPEDIAMSDLKRQGPNMYDAMVKAGNVMHA